MKIEGKVRLNRRTFPWLESLEDETFDDVERLLQHFFDIAEDLANEPMAGPTMYSDGDEFHVLFDPVQGTFPELTFTTEEIFKDYFDPYFGDPGDRLKIAANLRKMADKLESVERQAVAEGLYED